MKLIEALEGMEVKESDDFPQGDKLAAQGRPPGLPPAVHLRHQGRQAPAPRGRRPETRSSSRPPAVSRRRDDRSPAGLDGPGRQRPGPVGFAAAILRIEGLTMRFGGLAALNNVSHRGPARARSAPSSGPTARASRRSSTASPACSRPTGGRILFDGDDITGLPPHRDLAEGDRALVPDHQHPARRHRARERADRRAVAPSLVEPAPPPPLLRRRHRRRRARCSPPSAWPTRRTSSPPTSRTASSATSRSASRSARSRSSCASTSRRRA